MFRDESGESTFKIGGKKSDLQYLTMDPQGHSTVIKYPLRPYYTANTTMNWREQVSVLNENIAQGQISMSKKGQTVPAASKEIQG